MRVFMMAALLMGAADAAPAPRAAVMSALLGELAGEQSRPHFRPAGRRICIARTLSPLPLAGQRQPEPGDMKFDAPIGEPRRPWKPDSEEEARDRLWFVRDDLSPEQKQAQTAIQTAALRASEHAQMTGRAEKVDPAWLSANETLSTKGCNETISLSEPDIALDHAFINVKVQCGMLCGMRAMYVMRLQDGRWRTVDGRIHAIS
ncbi:hypothetical protein [Sphingomonas sp.]|uniref:hypothetical protein n=1 Tax=Sphingomonas sp. TaxID=28214 RepID=UPI0035C7D3AE